MACFFVLPNEKDIEKSRRRRVWNPSKTEWNQCEALHGIKPKERCTQTAMPYANGDSMHPAGDSMSILRIE